MMRAMVVQVELAEALIVDDPSLRDLLDDTELARAERKRVPTPFVSAHALVRTVLGDRLGVAPQDLRFRRLCPTCGSRQHGKPTLADHPRIAFSLSYTDTLAVVAVTEGVEVGVDVEHVSEADFGGFARVTLAQDEVDAFEGLHGPDLLCARAQVWSRKEAILKATGHGLVVDPTEVVVSAPREEPRLVAWRASEAAPEVVALHDAPLGSSEHRAAVAVLADGPVAITPVS